MRTTFIAALAAGLAFASGANAEWPTCGHVDAFPGADWRQTDPGRRGWDEAQLDAARQIFSGQPSAAVMVVHPSGSGLSRQAVNAIARARPHRLIYVSSDVATLARDGRSLHQSGYQLVEVQPIDMQPQTFHIETVSLWVRQE